jgi:hypothetical protein
MFAARETTDCELLVMIAGRCCCSPLWWFLWEARTTMTMMMNGDDDGVLVQGPLLVEVGKETERSSSSE